jgi:zinc protease
LSRLGTWPSLALPVVRTDLDCGATLLVSPRADAPIAAVQVHIRGGNALDPEGKEGLAHLAGALAPEGTRQRSESELAALLEPLGGSLRGSATGVSGSMVAGEWRTLLELTAELITEATYPKVRFERQRARLLERLQVAEQDPKTRGARAFRELIYGDHWLGRGERGTRDSVARIERRDLPAHVRRHWVASRAVIAVCGDLDPAAVHRFLERRLADWKTGRTLELGAPPERTPGNRTAAYLADRQQVHLYLGHLGIRRSDPDYVPLLVMDHVLGTGPGFTDRISRRLRDEEGLAYTVHANIHGSAGVHPGTFLAYIGTGPDKAGQALRGFIEEIRRIRSEPVLEEELDLAKSYLTGSVLLGHERAARRVGAMVYAQRLGLPFEHLSHLPAAIAEVSVADVRRVARRHLVPEDLVLSGAGPLSKPKLEMHFRAALDSGIIAHRKSRPRSRS